MSLSKQSLKRIFIIHSSRQFKPLFSSQIRNLQSRKPFEDPNRKITLFDGVAGVYNSPEYKLSLKPLETRDGQWKFWFIDNIGVTLIWLMGALALFFSFCNLTFHTLTDPQTTLRRDDYFPWLRIRNGNNLERFRNPWFKQYYSYACVGYDIRTLFYYEIEDAIQRRKELDEMIN